MRLLVLGASGMLGSSVLRYLVQTEGITVYGTVRTEAARGVVPRPFQDRVLPPVDVLDSEALELLLDKIRPHVVINCIGVVKQLSESADALISIPVNSLLPHRLAKTCRDHHCRLVHFGTDCVFAGGQGQYREDDVPDARDLYGRSKLLGEVDYPNAITLRTSIIGHELQGNRSLIDWFLSQSGTVRGFTRAVFSGLPTVEVARIIREFVLPRPDLHGLYHLSADPIAKYDLLRLVAEAYGKEVDLVEDDSVVIDRSLDSTRFRDATGFAPEPWPELVRRMRRFA